MPVEVELAYTGAPIRASISTTLSPQAVPRAVALVLRASHLVTPLIEPVRLAKFTALPVAGEPEPLLAPLLLLPKSVRNCVMAASAGVVFAVKSAALPSKSKSDIPPPAICCHR